LGQVKSLGLSASERMEEIRRMMSTVYIGEMTVGRDFLDRPPEF
jgi:hypothetical protein